MARIDRFVAVCHIPCREEVFMLHTECFCVVQSSTSGVSLGSDPVPGVSGSGCTHCEGRGGGGERGPRDERRWTRLPGGGRLVAFQSRSRRQRRGCWGNNGQGHLSCVAALPFTYNGFGGPASGGFLFSPLLSGDTSVPYNGPFVPSPLFANV